MLPSCVLSPYAITVCYHRLMSPENYLFEFRRCTALKVNEISHDITRNESENEAGIPQVLNNMDAV